MSDPHNYLGQALHAQGQVRGAARLLDAMEGLAIREKESAESWKNYALELRQTVVDLISEIKALRGIANTMHQEAMGEKPRHLSDMPLQDLNIVLQEEKRLSKAIFIDDIRKNGDISYTNPIQSGTVIKGDVSPEALKAVGVTPSRSTSHHQTLATMPQAVNDALLGLYTEVKALERVVVTIRKEHRKDTPERLLVMTNEELEDLIATQAKQERSRLLMSGQAGDPLALVQQRQAAEEQRATQRKSKP